MSLVNNDRNLTTNKLLKTRHMTMSRALLNGDLSNPHLAENRSVNTLLLKNIPTINLIIEAYSGSRDVSNKDILHDAGLQNKYLAKMHQKSRIKCHKVSQKYLTNKLLLSSSNWKLNLTNSLINSTRIKTTEQNENTGKLEEFIQTLQTRDEFTEKLPSFFVLFDDHATSIIIRQLQGPTFSREIDSKEFDEKQFKMKFVRDASSSLVSGDDIKSSDSHTRICITEHVRRLAVIDPEFVLKVAVYTRLELNIRTMANLLLALATLQEECRPYIEKYFAVAIRLPSDWLAVADLYRSISKKGRSFPAALRRAMVSKFPEFSEYQLAKYNKEKAIKNKKRREKLKRTQKSDKRSFAEVATPENKQPSDEISPLTLKDLTRRLHISKPTRHVMAIIGKKYPSSLSEFWSCGLEGMWQPELSAKRMKLALPETWETQLSLKGNKAETWQDLIDGRKLPFMAMLRNLRNLIMAGLEKNYHKIIIGILTNENFVLQSRQFPFRFLSAYEVVSDLKKQATAPDQIVRRTRMRLTPKQILQQKLVKKAKRKMAAIGSNIVQSLTERYQSALNKSIEIATIHNVPPIKGNTIIFCDFNNDMRHERSSSKALGKSKTAQELAALLALMCKYSCENGELVSFTASYAEIMQRERSKPIIDDVCNLITECLLHELPNAREGFDEGRIIANDYEDDDDDDWFPIKILHDILKDKKTVDNIVVLSNGKIFDSIPSFLEKYRAFVNPNLLFVSIDLTKQASTDDKLSYEDHPRNVCLSGFSEQILVFVAEGGGNQQLEHIENIDKKYKLKSRLKVKRDVSDLSTSFSPTIRTPKWHTVRVFISSTFRDMHGERDYLVRSVFPELRSRALNLCVDVHDVDLRWGITEQEADENKTVEICLREAERCEIFLGLLSERYGTIPSINDIPETEEFDWVREYPSGASITELEFYIGALASRAQSKSVICIRDTAFLNEMPQKYISDFLSENGEQEIRLEKLKSTVRSASVTLYDNYPCCWGGVKNGAPVVDGLDTFGETVLDKLWTLLQHRFSSDDNSGVNEVADREIAHHESFAERRVESFIGRKESIERCLAAVKEGQKLIIIAGKSGSGKTSLMAKLYLSLKKDNSLVIPYFSEVSAANRNVKSLIKYVCDEISSSIDDKNQLKAGDDISRLNLLLESAKHFPKKLILLLDGLDELSTDKLSMTWLPDPIAENVAVVCAVTENSIAFNTLSHRDSSVMRLNPLNATERQQLVKNTLAPYRKVLSESPFDNQLRSLTSKCDAGRPLYLQIACEELRLFWVFEKISEKLRHIPNTIGGLLNEIISQMEENFGRNRIQSAFQLLLLVKGGLSEEELYYLLNISCYFDNLNESPFDEICHCARRIKLIPRSWFAKFIRTLNTFLRSAVHNSKNLIFDLSHHEISLLVSRRYKTRNGIMYYKYLAAYFYSEADPRLDHSWAGKNPRAFENLITYLVLAGCREEAEKCLTNLRFLNAKINFGMAQQLLEDFVLVEKENCDISEKERFEDYKEFVHTQNNLLSTMPALFLQQALNDKNDSTVSIDAREILQTEAVPNVFEWCNKTNEADVCSFTWSTSSPINCLSVSSCETLMAAGLSNGQIYVIDITTHKVLHILFAQAEPVTSVCFIQSNKLSSAHANGSLSLWDIQSGNRVATVTGHNRQSTCCCCDAEGTTVVSVGWDCAVRVWSTKFGEEISVLKLKDPINTCAFHPKRQVVAIGLWDASVRIIDLISVKQIAVYRGHSSSVTCVAYSNCGKYVASGSLSGEIAIWSSQRGFQISAFQATDVRINDICFNNDATALYSVADDHAIKVWSSLFADEKYLTESIANVGIKAIALNNDNGEDLIVAYNDSTIVKINKETGQILFTVKPCNSEITSVHYGKIIIVGYYNDQTKLLDVATGKVCGTLQESQSNITSICILSTKFILCGRSDGTLRTYELMSKRDIRTELSTVNAHTGWVTHLSVNSHSQLCASVSRDQSLSIWQIHKNGKISLITSSQHCHADWITCCAWIIKSDCDAVLTGSNDNLIKLWKFKDNALTMFGVFRTMPSPVAFINVCEGCVLAGSTSGNIKMFTVKGTEVISIDCGPTNCFASQQSMFNMSIPDWYDEVIREQQKSDSRFVRKCVWPQGTVFMEYFGRVKCVKLFENRKVKILSGHTNAVTSMKLLSNGNLLSASSDETIRKWRSQRIEDSYDNKSEVTSIAWSPSEETVIACCRDGSGLLWKPGKTFSILSPISKFQLRSGGINCVHFTRENRFVAGSNDGTLTMWEIGENNKITLKAKLNFGHPILCVDYDDSQNFVAAGGWNGKAYVVDAITGQSGHQIEVSPSEWIIRLQFVTLESSVKLFVFDTRGRLLIFKFGQKLEIEYNCPKEKVFPHCFAHSNFDYVVGCTDGMLVSFNAHLERPTSFNRLHSAAIRCCHLDANGRFIITSSNDRFIKIWKLTHKLTIETQVAQYECLAPVSALSVTQYSNDQLFIVCGDVHGKINFLKLALQL